MTALAIPVKTMELALIFSVDITAAVKQVFLEDTVKKVSFLRRKKLIDCPLR